MKQAIVWVDNPYLNEEWWRKEADQLSANGVAQILVAACNDCYQAQEGQPELNQDAQDACIEILRNIARRIGDPSEAVYLYGLYKPKHADALVALWEASNCWQAPSPITERVHLVKKIPMIDIQIASWWPPRYGTTAFAVSFHADDSSAFKVQLEQKLDDGSLDAAVNLMYKLREDRMFVGKVLQSASLYMFSAGITNNCASMWYYLPLYRRRDALQAIIDECISSECDLYEGKRFLDELLAFTTSRCIPEGLAPMIIR